MGQLITNLFYGGPMDRAQMGRICRGKPATGSNL